MSDWMYDEGPVQESDTMRFSGDVEYRQDWACEPPPMGSRFRVTRDEWNDDATVRTIHEWEASPS